MTAEERAKDLYERLFRTGRHLHDPVPIDPMAIITDAIKQALEEAAKVCEDISYHQYYYGEGAYAASACETAVRALIEREET